MKDLIISQHCELQKNALVITGDVPFIEWDEMGKKLQEMGGAVHFWIGDWLLYGETRYGEEFAQALDPLSYHYSTLQNDKWVCRQIPASRRRGNLTFTHHVEVADMLPEDQDLLLTKAEEQKLSTRQFRQLTRQYKLRLEVPEAEPVKTPADFDLVQQVIDPSLVSLDKLQALSLNDIHVDARDYLLSHLRQAIGIMAKVVETYGK